MLHLIHPVTHLICRVSTRVYTRFVIRVILHLTIAILMLGTFVSPAAAPTVSAASTDASPLENRGTYYRVKYGDSLSKIAVYHGVSINALKKANGIHNPNHIYVGQKLLIPSGGYGQNEYAHHKPPQRHKGGHCVHYHRVQHRQTLSSIAVYYGVNVWVLARTNGIHNLNHIYVGQKLCIPSQMHPKPHRPKPHYPKPQHPKTHHPKPHDPSTGCKYHYVKRGDTVSKIASWYGTTVHAIVYANHLPNPNHIYVGQHLVIPSQYCKHPKPHHPKPHHPKPHYPKPHHPSPNPKPTAQPEPDAPYGVWEGRYYDNPSLSGEPVFKRHDGKIDFSWGWHSPDSESIPSDHFSVKWVHRAHFDAGYYRFFTTADDGVRVYVDGKVVIDAWRVQPPTHYYGDLHLDSGDHTIVVEYFESTGGAEIIFYWGRL